MDTIKSFLSKHWLATTFVTFAAIYWTTFIIFDGATNALLVVVFAAFLAAMIFANHMSATNRRYGATIRTLEERVEQSAAAANEARRNVHLNDTRFERKLFEAGIYRDMILTWLTKVYPSGTRLEHFQEGSGIELNTYLYVMLPEDLGLENRQLRFLLSDREKVMLHHLKTFEGERTTLLPGETGDTLWKFLHSQKPAEVRPESFAEDADALIAAAGLPQAVQQLEEATKPSGKPVRRGSRGGRKGQK